MVSPAQTLYPAQPIAIPKEWDGTSSWRQYLTEQLEYASQRCMAEIESEHPGAKHAAAELLRFGANLLDDLAELDRREGRR